MNRLYYLICFLALTTLLAACKKDNNVTSGAITTLATNTYLGSVYGGEPAIPSAASGALYAINQISVNGGVTSTSSSAYAWFGNDTLTLQPATVSANGNALSIPLATSWYNEGPEASAFPNSITWNVTGSNTVIPFTNTDSTAFATITGFNLADTISASSPLSVTAVISNPFDIIIYTLSGSKGVVTQSSTSGSTATFSVAQVDNATASGDTNVSLEVATIKTTLSALNGDNYYFVKQYVYKKATVTGP